MAGVHGDNTQSYNRSLTKTSSSSSCASMDSRSGPVLIYDCRCQQGPLTVLWATLLVVNKQNSWIKHLGRDANTSVFFGTQISTATFCEYNFLIATSCTNLKCATRSFQYSPLSSFFFFFCHVTMINSLLCINHYFLQGSIPADVTLPIIPKLWVSIVIWF